MPSYLYRGGASWSEVSSTDLPTSGVTAGTYGDGTNVSQVTVNAEGIVTAAANVAITAGGGGGLTKLFDSTLAVDTAAIDTGAGGIAAGSTDLIVSMLLRTDDAAANGTVNVTLNNDTGNNYDFTYVYGLAGSVSQGNDLGTAAWAFGAHGSGGSAGYAAAVSLFMPSYAGTTFWKGGNMLVAKPDATAGNPVMLMGSVGYRSASAISRMKVTAIGAAKLKAGSRLTIYGTP